MYLFDIERNFIIEIDENDNNEIENLIDKLYYQKFRPLIKEDVENDKNVSNKLLEKIKADGFDKINSETKEKLSKISSKIPLYDAYSENIYLIKKHNVYFRVTHQFYRFPEESLLEKIKKEKDDLMKMIELNKKDEKLLMRKMKKWNLIITFMGYFDLNILFETYVKVFYKYSKFVGKEITVCKNPSFLPQFTHIKPYLTRSEVINSALNFGIVLPEDYIESEKVNDLCKKIIKYQINANVLLEHQHHIINSNNLGLVQYYTLQGSFFMNQYLRSMTSYHQQNEYLESIIRPMWDLVLNAPSFDKSYVFYRFVGRDDYLKSLKLGEIFVEKGFMSTTRDPFYRADLYKFGFILLKIKVPANKVGVALCLETISHFPEEQEIIFPPNTKFKLVARDENCEYYHTDINFTSKIKTRYEFEWVENDPIKFNRIVKYIDNNPQTKLPLDFLKIRQTSSITLLEKIKYFDNTYVNEMGQFDVKIGDKNITVLTEWFDSTGAYKDYYAIETNMGYAMYSIYKGYILFYIELGETKEGKQMHLNYFVKYSSIDPSKVIGNENLIKFFSSIAHYFDIYTVILYASYLNCGTELIQSGGVRQRGFEGNTEKITNGSINKFINKKKISDESNQEDKFFGLIGGSYCNDIYQYLLDGTKMYSDTDILNVELQPKFSYHDLNYLKSVSPTEILLKEDPDEIYQLYDKYYKYLKRPKINTITDFYLWLIEENRCYLLDTFIDKIDRILGKNNPFKNDMYILDSATYLYNRKHIQSYPTNMSITPTLKRPSSKKIDLNGILKNETFDQFDEFRSR